jgi:hypothetical protein
VVGTLAVTVYNPCTTQRDGKPHSFVNKGFWPFFEANVNGEPTPPQTFEDSMFELLNPETFSLLDCGGKFFTVQVDL